MTIPNDLIRPSEEIMQALASGRPVVALESTVISHGLPYPDNLWLARKLEETIRAEGALPATIALIGGFVRVGLSDEQLELLASEQDVAKVSLRNMGLVLAGGGLGATTVAGTMWAAHGAGIGVFSTGGVGGIHPGDGGDVSADLPALATIPMAVVSSGAKAILDLPRTREWLETWGVPILGYQSADFPAFYSRESGLPVDHEVATVGVAARVIRTHLSLARSAILVGVPVPAEDALDADQVDRWLAEAHAAADAQGIRGYQLTPFLLQDLAERSGGATLRANLALLTNNAEVAARLAVALATEGA